MSLLDPLLEIQELDLAADAARDRCAQLAERATLPLLHRALDEIQTRLNAALAEQDELLSEEEQIGVEVSRVVHEVEAAEVKRYSGKHFDREEASAHDAAQAALRERKLQLEDRELRLLELIEGVEARIAELQSEMATNRAEADRVAQTIETVESETTAERAHLLESRAALAAGLPANILTAYDRVRVQPRAGGRASAALSKGQCGACQIKLPVHENAKMLLEPEDALIQCPQCRRVLVRE